MVSDLRKISSDWSKVASKLPFNKLDKYQTLNGLFDILAMVCFVAAVFRVEPKSIVPLFFGCLAFMGWCIWLCRKSAKS